MSNHVIRTDEADVVVRPGATPGRTKLKIAERYTDPSKHVAIAYLDDAEAVAVARLILPPGSVIVPRDLDDATVKELATAARDAYWDELDDSVGWGKVVRAVFAKLVDDR